MRSHLNPEGEEHVLSFHHFWNLHNSLPMSVPLLVVGDSDSGAVISYEPVSQLWNSIILTTVWQFEDLPSLLLAIFPIRVPVRYLQTGETHAVKHMLPLSNRCVPLIPSAVKRHINLRALMGPPTFTTLRLSASLIKGADHTAQRVTIKPCSHL